MIRIAVAMRIAGMINIILAVAMLLPLFVAIIYREADVYPFLISVALTGGSGLALLFLTVKANMDVSHREGFIVVAISWINAVVFSSLPYLLSGVVPSVVDAFFEATSGITTTGATIFSDVESLPYGLILWRSMTHWLGGMGIVVLSVAVMPFLGVGGMQLYKAEASSISGEKFVPRIQEMAKILVFVYLFLSFVMLTMLLISGMPLFDAFIHTIGGISTGGFSLKNASVGAYNNIHAEWIIIIFMILGATNFALHYDFYRTGIRAYTDNEEFRFYIFVMVVATLFVTLNLWLEHYESMAESFRYAFFQVVSITTTAGYTTADFSLWPFFSQMVLLILMFIGGSAGSTTGAIKCVRVLVLLKLLYKEVYRLIHPHAVTPVKLNGKVIPPEVLRSVAGFTFLFFLVFVLSAGILTALGLDLVSAISAAAATIGNVGPALGMAGPVVGYGDMPDAAKWILIVNMILGRLEIYTLFILLFPAFWRG